MIDSPALRPITLEDIIESEGLEEYKGKEIVDGVWVNKHDDGYMSIGHGQFGGRLFVPLWTHVESNHLGVVYMSETIFILHVSDQGVRKMRKPDAAFVVSARVKPPEAGYYFQAPDLAIEIISPSDKFGVLRSKLRDYFTYGTQQVWLVYAEDQEIIVHTALDTYTTYGMGSKVPGGDLLPGFELDVAYVFGTTPKP
jgi:Uma2 family endonuclease